MVEYSEKGQNISWHFSLITESIQQSCTWSSFGKNCDIIVMLQCRLKWQQLCAARDFLVIMFPTRPIAL